LLKGSNHLARHCVSHEGVEEFADFLKNSKHFQAHCVSRASPRE